ncbi:MAG: hypothetical protein IH602_17685 [Bryobacteraceae bacterium]|nr:hypothetical protein [Bryobacteraceae bacterium]
MVTQRNGDGGVTSKRRDTALLFLALLICTGFALAMLYSFRAASAGEILGRLAVAALTGGAATMIGGLLGFLFGIPRTFQGDQGGDSQRREGSAAIDKPAYRPNTSLEQISDWLTKILVGVGLTQIGALRAHFDSLSHGLGRAFGGQPIDEAFVSSLVAMLAVAGFLFGFLWTRIYLPGAFRAADLDAVRGEVMEELGRQADTDADALSLVDQQLTSAPDQTPVPEDKLTAAIAQATSNAKHFIFERARENRSRNWQSSSSKTAMERSIPIFRALIKAGGDSPIAHRYYGQLGFALKDQVNPDWKAAEEALTTAIRLRGPAQDFGYQYYELNRAICRIMLDEGFKQDKPSDPSVKALILADLRAAYQVGLADIVLGEQMPAKWLQLNSISKASLARA